MKQLLKEPLLHFMLIGAGLFGIYAWVNPSEEASPDQIVVSQGRIEQMISIYEKTWQRLPSEEELKALVDDYVLEEIYYRQAQEMGMDQDDTIIRRRMRQKLEFLTDEVLLAEDVDEQVLEQYLADNADAFREDARYSFEQVYINPQKHGDGLDAYLEEVGSGLRVGSEVQSDSYFVAREHSDLPAWKVDREFGQDFADQLNGLNMGEWSEPISSGLGIHFVRLSKRDAGRLPDLADVHDKVKREWIHHQKLEKRRALNEKFLERYEVVIEWPTEKTGA